MQIQLPYSFHSESVHVPLCITTSSCLYRFRTGDIKLSIWLEHIIDGEREKISAFDSIVVVVEPELSIFDFKLLRHSLQSA